MTHITISYRRSDSDAIAGRIRDRLASHFGDESVFMDIDSIPFGFDFRDHIQEALAQNDILIAVIGPQWLGPGKGRSLRIMDETDPVQIRSRPPSKSSAPSSRPGRRRDAGTDRPAGSLKNWVLRRRGGRGTQSHAERLIRSMDFILSKKAKAATSAPATPAVDKPFAAAPPEPVHVPPPPAPAPKAPEMPSAPVAAVAPEPVRAASMPVHVSPSRAPWIVAAVAVLVAGGAIGAAVLYLKAPATKGEPAVTTSPPSCGAEPPPGRTGAKLDIRRRWRTFR